MNRLSSMEYRAEFLRGWPLQDGGLDTNHASDNSALTCGDLVLAVAGNKVKKCDAESGAGKVGIVVRGPADDKSVRVAGGIASGNGTGVVGGGNTCIVLWGHYIVRTTNVVGTPSIGDELAASATGQFAAPAAAGVHVLGHVMGIDTLADGSLAYVILVR